MPFGPDCQYADMDACVADNGDKDDPQAYCATLMEDTEAACMDGDMPGGMATNVAAPGQHRWTGTIAIEGEPTGDGRMIERGALTWGDDPIPLIWDRRDGDHTGEVVGRVTKIWRQDDMILAEGDLSQSEDPETQAAVGRVVELLTEGAMGVSVGMDSQDIEVRISKELLEEIEAEQDEPVIVAATPTIDQVDAAPKSKEDRAVEWLRTRLAFGDMHAAEVIREGRKAGHSEKTLRRAKAALEVQSRKGADGKWYWALTAAANMADEDGQGDGDHVVVAKWRNGDELEVTTFGRIRHLALLDTAAIAGARIALTASIALVASLDLDAFADPQFGATGDADNRLSRQEPERPGEAVAWGAPLTVTDDGRVFGHAALWGRCHAGFSDRCTVAPRSGSYGRFLSGSAVPGVATGPITVGTTHAKLTASPGEAMDHYADTGRAVADVAVGEDRHGIWVAGRLRPGVSDRDVAALKGSSLSGDWRFIGGDLRLVGLLAVNQPGFLIERQALAASNGAMLTAGPCDCDDALVASLPVPFTTATLTLEGDAHDPVVIPFTLDPVDGSAEDAAVEWGGQWFALVRRDDDAYEADDPHGEDPSDDDGGTEFYAVDDTLEPDVDDAGLSGRLDALVEQVDTLTELVAPLLRAHHANDDG